MWLSYLQPPSTPTTWQLILYQHTTQFLCAMRYRQRMLCRGAANLSGCDSRAPGCCQQGHPHPCPLQPGEEAQCGAAPLDSGGLRGAGQQDRAQQDCRRAAASGLGTGDNNIYLELFK